MTPEQRDRAAALKGRERLPAVRDMLRVMHDIDQRRTHRHYDRWVRLASTPRRRAWLAERIGCALAILALIAAVLFL